MVLSKSEKAMLEVASRAKDDAPSLMDVAPVKRVSAKGQTSRRPSVEARPSAKGEPEVRKGPDSTKPVPPPAPKTKPKVRLVNGKLVPIDDSARLFDN